MTDQTQTTTEPVAWRVRPKGALGDVMGFQVVTDPYVAKDYADQPAFEVQPLYTTPQPLAIGLDRERAVVEEWLAIVEDCSRVGPTGVLRYPPICNSEIEAIRSLLALAAPAEGYVLVPVDVVQPFIDAMKDIRPDDHDTSKICLATVADYRRLAACLPAAPTGGRS